MEYQYQYQYHLQQQQQQTTQLTTTPYPQPQTQPDQLHSLTYPTSQDPYYYPTTQTENPSYSNHQQHQYYQETTITATSSSTSLSYLTTETQPSVPAYYSYAYDPNTTATTTTTSYDDANNVLAPTYYHYDPNWPPNPNPSVDPYAVQTQIAYHNPNDNVLASHGQLQYVTPIQYYSAGTNQEASRQWKYNSKKGLKKVNIPLSFPCDVCKILCDTQDVLDKHRLGKKHKKSLEKLKAAVSGVSTATPVLAINPQTSTQPAQGKSTALPRKTGKKRASDNTDDLETKKKQAVVFGAQVEAVRTCSVCNIVCNSEIVFQSHLAGQKHAAKVKKQGYGEVIQAAAVS